jgi:hypothetical protein
VAIYKALFLVHTKNYFICVYMNMPIFNELRFVRQRGERQLSDALSIHRAKVRQACRLALLPARDLATRIARVSRKTRLVFAGGEFFLAQSTSFKV